MAARFTRRAALTTLVRASLAAGTHALIGAGLLPRQQDRALIVRAGARISEELRRGIELGVEEADRTAKLLGRRVLIESSAAGASELTATVAARDGTTADADGCVFQIGLRAADRKRLEAAQQAARQRRANTGRIRIEEWHPSLDRYGASEINDRFLKAFDAPMTSLAWTGWFAVKALAEAALRAESPEAWCRAIEQGRFDGHKGRPLTFAARVLQQPIYVVDGDRVVDSVLTGGTGATGDTRTTGDTGDTGDTGAAADAARRAARDARTNSTDDRRH